MNWYSQLTQLILDFYREDPLELQQLHALHTCKLTRRWGVLRIDCRNAEIAERIAAASAVLKEPIAQLRLAQQIKILANGILVATLPVQSSRIRTES
jgi:hypothetical protein